MKRNRQQICPICERILVIDEFEKPIQHWGCRGCHTVFVKDEEGLISAFGMAVKYLVKDIPQSILGENK